MSTETQETVVAWIEATFPGGDPKSPRKALRALEEMVELCLASGANFVQVRNAVEKVRLEYRDRDDDETRYEPAKVSPEAADVLIVLYGLAGLRGFDIHKEVDKKMKINRERRWAPRGDGTGYHIKESK